MRRINRFLLEHDLRLRSNPCVSPDFCLDWPALCADLEAGRGLRVHPRSDFRTADGSWELIENETGDHAWLFSPALAGMKAPLSGESVSLADGRQAFPATWEHLLELKNLVLEADPGATIFPTAGGRLGESTIGVGARFTTLHWPGVDWAMAHLGMGFTANQNSIPRELVYDVDAMLDGTLDAVPFPFIGTTVPEGHQGQSVEGMSHGCVLAKLKHGFHHHRLAWSFNADHQPIGGAYDAREDALVRGCLLASYITFDLSPELSRTEVPDSAEARAAFVAREMDRALFQQVKARVAEVGLSLEEDALHELLCRVWPAMKKMQRRDAKYRAIREEHFSTPEGRRFLRELSIDELPGLTTPATTAIMLALCEAMEMPVDFIAPAFGFQKNMPYPDNDRLRELVSAQWAVCRPFGVSLGFHSGSGKSAENYAVLGEVTGGALEIKTSGRYTYEMGRALAASGDPGDQALWGDWYAFTRELAVSGAFSVDKAEREAAREFITAAFQTAGKVLSPSVFTDEASCRAALQTLPPSPEAMFWFEYNFLFVLAREGRAEKAALGDHSAAGYAQRARFYGISEEGQLAFARNVAAYLVFLVRSTGLVPAEKCDEAQARLARYHRWSDFLAEIAPL
ncbi:MAG: tagaturonate epimerase family protein [Opitutales bacterium]